MLFALRSYEVQEMGNFGKKMVKNGPEISLNIGDMKRCLSLIHIDCRP